jgi:signal transduction histidine kinase
VNGRRHPRILDALGELQRDSDAGMRALDALSADADARLSAWARVMLQRVHFERGDYDRVLAGLVEPRRTFERLTDDAGMGHAALIEGNVHLERADYEDAARCFVAARALLERTDDVESAAKARHNLGLVFWRVGDLPSARAELEQAAQVFRRVGDTSASGNTYNSLGLIAEEEGEVESALAHYAAALPLLRSSNADVYVANVLANIAGVHEKRGALEEATAYHVDALAIRERIGHRRGQVGSRVELARIRIQRGEVAAASRLLAEARPEAEALGLRKHVADILGLEARVAAAEGRWEDAYRREAAAATARAELASAETARRIALIQTRAEIASARREAARQARENAALRAANEAAEAASSAKGAFIAMMSHEIRTPLTTVIGAAELLAATRMDPRQQKLLDGILAGGQALNSLVDQVLDLSRMDAGRLELADEVFDLDALCAQVAAVGAAAAQRRGIGFASERAVAPPRRRGDAARLRQVLLNLVTNAVKFTERGGVTLRIEADRSELRADIEDTGIGIDAETLDQLFRPFVQADRTRTRRFGGSGLGLAISLGIVERMGGRIDVTSAPGTGSVFHVRVPCTCAEEAEQAGTAPRAGRMGVLLVEDDAQVASVVTQMLERLGCTVVHADSGIDAVDAALAQRFDVAVVDVHMPRMDGFETTRRLRALRHPPRVLGLSGGDASTDRDRARAAGMVDFLTKPVTLDTLARALERVGQA